LGLMRTFYGCILVQFQVGVA